MKKLSVRFSAKSTIFYFDAAFTGLSRIVDRNNAVLITDEHIFQAHPSRFRGWNCIVLKPGEQYKVQATVDSIIEQLITLEADRRTTLVGVGGGVVTDITGYAASVYMRGIPFGFVPTSLLAMVDASIGGKNGIDVGLYKNMVGLIRQPDFLLYDVGLLKTLPEAEWRNGFAEIIKHACIRDAAMFRQLESQGLEHYRKKRALLASLVERNARIKIKVVLADEFEKGERRLLNFGHTLAHALENQYALSHGEAVAIGMTYALGVSEALAGFGQKDRVVNLIQAYGLPTYASFDRKKAFALLKMDKKRERSSLNYILLEKIGKGIVRPIAMKQLEKIIQDI
jgi:3-dehydroquinate synthase